MRCALCGRSAEVLWAGHPVCAQCQEPIVFSLKDRRWSEDVPDEGRIAAAVERAVEEKRSEQAREAQGVML